MKKSLLCAALSCMTVLPSFAAYTLTWSDEFNCDQLNTTIWNYETGTGTDGWGNWEMQYYSNSTENVYVSDGSLKIRLLADETDYNPSYNSHFTSGRIKSNAKVQAKYGKIEARIALPSPRKGLWPAFWMLGTGADSWPYQGEFDIMEFMCTSESYNTINGTLHWNDKGALSGTYSHSNYGGTTTVSNPTDWHTYTMEWTPTYITFLVDGNQYFIMTTSGMECFQHEAYLIFNMAIGGSFVNYNYDSTIEEAIMKVDWVRVYQDESAYPASSLTDNSTECAETGGDDTKSDYEAIKLLRDNDLSYNYLDLTSSNFYTWEGTTEAATIASGAAEGSNYLAIKTTATSESMGWFGAGYNYNANSYDYSFAENLTLHFRYYTTYNGEIKISSFGGDYTLTPAATGQWVEAEIAMTDFTGASFTTAAEVNPFSVSGGNIGSGYVFAFDDIYFYESSSPVLQAGEASGVITSQGGTATIALTGSHLTGNVSVTSSNTNFSVSPASITPDNGGVSANVTVTYTGSGSESATITFTSGAATTTATVSSLISQETSGCNLLAGISQTSGYYAPNWSQISDPVATVNGYDLSFTLSAATYKQWQAQVAFLPASNIVTTAGTSYTATMTLLSNQTVSGVTVKIMDTNDSFLCGGTVDLTAGTPYEFSYTGTPGAITLRKILFDLGGNPENTTLSVSGIVIKETSCTETTPSITSIAASDACVGASHAFQCTTDGFSGTPTVTYEVLVDGNYVAATNGFTAPAAGTYTLRATAVYGNEEASATTVFTAKALPSASISASATEITCATPNVTLSAVSDDASTYAWSDAGNTTDQPLTVTAAGTYEVYVTGSDLCTSSAQITITENLVTPTVSVDASHTAVTCAVGAVTLTAQGTNIGSYLWSNGVTSNQTSVSATGYYSVTVTNAASGCTATAGVNIGDNHTAPTVNVTASNAELTCAAPTAELTATGTGINSYLWSNGATSDKTSISKAGYYSVTVTNAASGCTATAGVNISDNSTAPEVSISASTTELNGQVPSATLTAETDATTYQWSTGDQTKSIKVSKEGDYSVTVTGDNGCTANASIAVSKDYTQVKESTFTFSVTGGANSLTIRFDGIYDVMVRNITGKTIAARKAACGGIEVNGLGSGLYLVTVNGVTHKVAVK